MEHVFYIVDVFAEEKYAGNQLGVFRNANDLSDKDMQKIAKEMNYSETTFILADEERDGGFDVRIFTPEEELPFAGHPTLGTAFVIQQEIMKKPVEKIILNLKVGKIPVTFSYDVGKLKPGQHSFGIDARDAAGKQGWDTVDVTVSAAHRAPPPPNYPYLEVVDQTVTRVPQQRNRNRSGNSRTR